MVERFREPLVGLVLAVILCVPAGLEAQQRGRQERQGQDARQEQVAPDTLLAQLRALQARLDSLEALLRQLRPGDVVGGTERGREGRGRQEGPRPRASDELAALRAAARARVADAPPLDTTTGPSVLKSRNLNDFNPEISVTGDARFVGYSPGPQSNNVDLREFTVQLQAPLDPFSHALLAVAVGETGEFTLEEAYGYWTGLPGGVRLDAGRFRQHIGELNRWHLHALPQSEYALVLREYFGDDGLVGDGISLYSTLPVQAPGGGVHEVWAQITRGGDEVMFQEGDRISYMGRVNNFWQVSDATYFQIGGSALWGENPDAELEATVFAGDFRLSWVPPGRALHNSFTIRGEVFSVEQTVEDEVRDRLGAYLSSTVKVNQKWNVGARYDYVEPLDMPGEHIWAIVPQITYWQSEFVFLRGEWGMQSVPSLDGGRKKNSVFGIQIVWSLGPHKHETY